MAFQAMGYPNILQILIETSSAIFKHYAKAERSNFVTHSTIKILKAIKPNERGQHPNVFQKFPTKFTTRISYAPILIIGLPTSLV